MTCFPTLATSARSKAAACLLLVILADRLFYPSFPLGGVTGGFLALLAAAMLLHRPASVALPARVWMLLTLGQAAAIMISPSPLTLGLGVFCLGGMAIGRERLLAARPVIWLYRLAHFLLTGWMRLFADLRRCWKRGHRASDRPRNPLRLWLLPLLFGGVFLLLFDAANPILSRALARFDGRWLPAIEPPRLVFWLAMAAILWSLLRPRLRRLVDPGSWNGDLGVLEAFLNPAAIRLSLALFNAMFLFQNGLDIVFLWSGAPLPAGMSAAQYAHQGAYPLVVTALLSALFVLLALKPGRATERDPVIRWLVYGWIAQNLFLVASSMNRLAGYTSEYSLTYLRVAAFLWMGLVATGLLLIVARIAFGKAQSGLVGANLLALFGLLYIVSFVDLGGMIAGYNVRHCREVSGQGNPLDVFYLQQIGVSALPALYWFERQSGLGPERKWPVERAMAGMRQEVEMRQGDGRSWNLRNARILAQLPPVDVDFGLPRGWRFERP